MWDLNHLRVYISFCVYNSTEWSTWSNISQNQNVTLSLNPLFSFHFYLAAIFQHLGWLSSLRSLKQSSKVVCNLKMSISVFDNLAAIFSHFRWFVLLRSLCQSSEVECNPKTSISFFDDFLAISFCILVDFCCLDCSPDHQKLNIIQKWAFIFWWFGGHFSHFRWLLLLRSLSRSSEIECNPKTSILFFWWFGSHFFTFQFHRLDCSANHQKLNVIQKEHFIFWWFFRGRAGIHHPSKIYLGKIYIPKFFTHF